MAISKAYMKAPQRMDAADSDVHIRHHTHRHANKAHHHHHQQQPQQHQQKQQKQKQRTPSVVWLSHHGVAHVDTHTHRRHATAKLFVKNGLSREAADLKQRIMTSCPDTIVKFSFSCMRRLVTPPVAIPLGLASERALSTIVAGKRIPMTRAMWAKRRQQLEHRLLDRIDEQLCW